MSMRGNASAHRHDHIEAFYLHHQSAVNVNRASPVEGRRGANRWCSSALALGAPASASTRWRQCRAVIICILCIADKQQAGAMSFVAPVARRRNLGRLNRR